MLKDFRTWVTMLAMVITVISAFTARADDQSLQSQYVMAGKIQLSQNLATYVAPDDLSLGNKNRHDLEQAVQNAYLNPNQPQCLQSLTEQTRSGWFLIESRIPVDQVCITYQGNGAFMTTPDQYATWTDWERTSREALTANTFLFSLCSVLVLGYIYFAPKYLENYSRAWTWTTAFLAILAAPIAVIVVFAGVLEPMDISQDVLRIILVGLLVFGGLVLYLLGHGQISTPFMFSGLFVVLSIDWAHETTTVWMLLSGLVWGIPLMMALRLFSQLQFSSETFAEV